LRPNLQITTHGSREQRFHRQSRLSADQGPGGSGGNQFLGPQELRVPGNESNHRFLLRIMRNQGEGPEIRGLENG
jgi:hypothetical protein